MKLRQAIRIVSPNSHQRYIYPKCVQDIEDKIKHLKRLSAQKANEGKIPASNRRREKAQTWEGILKQDFWNRSQRDLTK